MDEKDKTAEMISWSDSENEEPSALNRTMGRAQTRISDATRMNEASHVGTLDDLRPHSKPIEHVAAETSDRDVSVPVSLGSMVEETIVVPPVAPLVVPLAVPLVVPQTAPQTVEKASTNEVEFDSGSETGYSVPANAQTKRKTLSSRSSELFSPAAHYPVQKTTPSSSTRRGSRKKFFSPAEVEYLKDGYKRHGNRWAVILSEYPFDPQRTAVDLKDKVRNLKNHEIL